MAINVLTDAKVIVNNVDLSDHADNLTLADTANQVDITAFGTSGYMAYAQGLKTASITVDFFNDYAAASVHSTLQPLYQSGGTFLVEIRPTSAAVSATNPRGSMVARLYDYSGLTGAIGAANKQSVTFHNAGTAGLTWGTV